MPRLEEIQKEKKALRNRSNMFPASKSEITEIWEFPKIRGTSSWGPYKRILLFRVLS